MRQAAVCMRAATTITSTASLGAPVRTISVRDGQFQRTVCSSLSTQCRG